MNDLPMIPEKLLTPIGTCMPARVEAGEAAFRMALGRFNEPFFIVREGNDWAMARGGEARIGGTIVPQQAAFYAFAPTLPPERLGDASFREDHGLRFAYVTGAMANGIASAALVKEMGSRGMLGFFGAAGLPLARVEAAIDDIQNALGVGAEAKPYGFNLIHSPSEPRLEAEVANLYLRRGVRLIEASAYLDLTLPLVRYRLTGIHEDSSGRVIVPNRVVAKVSRIEVARRFFSPAAEKFVKQLVQSGELTEAQARMAERIPVAQDLTAEADSGGHTDNRPLVALVPTMIALRDEIMAERRYVAPLRVGAAGGIGTPAAAAAAFAMGAAYIVTGSVNQACVESGTSDVVRKMLAETRQADVAMAPAADMFEMGVKLQVVKRGTMFAMRAGKLYEIYRAYARWDAVPPESRAMVERDYFRATFDDVWKGTQAFFTERDPGQLARAETDPKHKMALVFRWYLGLSSHWANAGEPTRQIDYQIWCGPAMGAFNEWVKGSFLEDPANRKAGTVALNLMHGAATLTRLNILRAQGIDLPPAYAVIKPSADLV